MHAVVNTLAITMAMVVCAGILVVASAASAGSQSEKLFLRCSGYSKLYGWQVDYKLAVNLDSKQITDADGNIYETVKFNDGIIVIKRQFESYTADGLSGQNPTPTEHSLELSISRIGLNFSAVEYKGGFQQKEITEGLLEVPSAKGSCSRVSGF